MEQEKGPFELEPENSLTGRIKQTFQLVFSYWKPLFFYPLVVTLILGVVSILFSKASHDFLFAEGKAGNMFVLGLIDKGLASSMNMFTFFVLITLVMVLVMVMIEKIVLTLVVLYGIFSLERGQTVSFSQSFTYMLSRLFRYLGVFWHTFKYVFLVPTIVIFSGFVLGMFAPEAGTTVYLIGVILSLVFALNRGPQVFAVAYIARDEKIEEKDVVKESIALTKNKWWETVANFSVFWLVIVSLSSLFRILIRVLPLPSDPSLALGQIVRYLPFLFLFAFHTSLSTVFGLLLYKRYEKGT